MVPVKMVIEELDDLCSSPDIIHVMKQRMRWVGCVACVGELNVRYWWGNQKERDHLAD